MKKKIFVWIGVFYLAFSGGGGCNIFSDIANKNSDAAIIDDVTNLIDNGKWNDAILKLALLSTAGKARRDVQLLYATAYAGRGGLDVLNLANTMNGTGNPATLFLTLLKAFQGAKISQFNDEVTAEGYMHTISATAAGRTADENMFVLFLELAKLGTLFAAVADPNATGALDPAFTSACTGISSAQADQVATAIGNILDALSGVTSSIVGSAAGPIVTQCAAAAAALGTPICNITSTASVTPLMEQFMKTLVGETNAGIGLEVAATHDICEITGTMGACSATVTPNLCP